VTDRTRPCGKNIYAVSLEILPRFFQWSSFREHCLAEIFCNTALAVMKVKWNFESGKRGNEKNLTPAPLLVNASNTHSLSHTHTHTRIAQTYTCIHTQTPHNPESLHHREPIEIKRAMESTNYRGNTCARSFCIIYK
jgi:hypothetical protein